MSNDLEVYTADSIQTLVGLDAVRHRPRKYLPDTDQKGQVHLEGEILDNAMDELFRRVIQGLHAQLDVVLLWDEEKSLYQILTRDNGRGLPIDKLKDCYTKLSTSGKFNQDAYKFSSGQFGEGAKVVAGLAKRFRVISTCLDGIGSYRVLNGIGDPEVIIDPTIDPNRGTTVIYEPDPQFFENIDMFDTIGFQLMILRMKKLAYFSKVRILFKRHVGFIAESFWDAAIPDARALLDGIVNSNNSVVAFDSHNFDRDEFIREYWRIHRPFAWKIALALPVLSNEATLGFEVHVRYAKGTDSARYFGLVNSVGIDDHESDHLRVVMSLIQEALAPMIEKKEIRQFFLKDYKLPICIAANVLYSGAELSGTTKDRFKDKKFASQYRDALLIQMNVAGMADAMIQLYELVAQDIVDKYNAQAGNITKTKDLAKMFLDLKRPMDFHDCNSNNPEEKELLVMEGKSAGGGSAGDSETQASYSIQGKTLNALSKVSYKTIGDNIQKIRAKLMQDAIFHDIIKILGVNPSKFDPADLNFKRLIIATDADSDGYHICNLLISNLYVLCPQLLELGIIHIMAPPLFGVYVGKYTKQKEFVYLRNRQSMALWKCHVLYRKQLEIEIKYGTAYDKPHALTDEEFEFFVLNVIRIGEKIRNLASELVLDPITVEHLALITSYLDKTTMDTQKIKEILGVDMVLYDEFSDSLTIVKGHDDLIIPLQNVRQRIYDTIRPDLMWFKWKKLEIYITSKHTKEYQRTPMTLMELYGLLKHFDGHFHIERFKGLGQMPRSPTDQLYETCLNPDNRVLYQLKEMGDLERVFQMMGDDPRFRQKLLSK